MQSDGTMRGDSKTAQRPSLPDLNDYLEDLEGRLRLLVDGLELQASDLERLATDLLGNIYQDEGPGMEDEPATKPSGALSRSFHHARRIERLIEVLTAAGARIRDGQEDLRRILVPNQPERATNSAEQGPATL